MVMKSKRYQQKKIIFSDQLSYKHKDGKYWPPKAIWEQNIFYKNNYVTHTCCIHCSPSAPAPGTPGWLCLILAASAPAEDAFHKSIPILRFVAGIETTGFPGTDDWEMGPVVLFCALAPEVHGNTNLFQQQREKKKDTYDCRWGDTYHQQAWGQSFPSCF